jgi:methyl-accepting chemotaxis protein
LEKARKALTEEYITHQKAILDKGNENRGLDERRSGLADDLLAAAESLSTAVEEVAREFSAQIVTAVGQVNVAMATGAVLALAVSLVLSLFITRSIVGPINHIIENLSASAQEVDGASSQLTTASNTLAEGATENAASLEETSAALEELSAMTRRNADNAVEANALMARGAQAVIQAESSMAKVIVAMEEISRSGNEIGKIIKTIDEIAFQTNLLALNAAVEAVRAGEAGAGFAVVADEVRNLAIRSADAAKNTSELIEATIANINSGSEMVNITAEAFKTVEANASKVSELVSEVAEASREQSQGIGQITTAMSEMDRVTQSKAASAEESASAAGTLSLQAGNLLTAVNEMEILAHGAGGQGRAAGQSRRLAGPAPRPAPRTGGGAQAAPTSSKALPMDDFDF